MLLDGMSKSRAQENKPVETGSSVLALNRSLPLTTASEAFKFLPDGGRFVDHQNDEIVLYRTTNSFPNSFELVEHDHDLIVSHTFSHRGIFDQVGDLPVWTTATVDVFPDDQLIERFRGQRTECLDIAILAITRNRNDCD